MRKVVEYTYTMPLRKMRDEHASTESPTLRLNHSPPCLSWFMTCTPGDLFKSLRSQKGPGDKPRDNERTLINQEPFLTTRVAALTDKRTRLATKTAIVTPDVQMMREIFSHTSTMYSPRQ